MHHLVLSVCPFIIAPLHVSEKIICRFLVGLFVVKFKPFELSDLNTGALLSLLDARILQF